MTSTLTIIIPIQKFDLNMQEVSEFVPWLEVLKSDEVDHLDDDYPKYRHCISYNYQLIYFLARIELID